MPPGEARVVVLARKITQPVRLAQISWIHQKSWGGGLASRRMILRARYDFDKFYL